MSERIQAERTPQSQPTREAEPKSAEIRTRSFERAAFAPNPGPNLGAPGERPGGPRSFHIANIPIHPPVVQAIKAPPMPPKTERDYVGANTKNPAGITQWLTTESWLSYKAGDPQPTGSVPGEDPPGYNFIRNSSLTALWIRFHLVNEQAGGKGIAKNLVPTSQKTNQDPDWKNFETDEKNEYNSGRTFHVATEVVYNAASALTNPEGRKWQHLFPSAITGKLHTWNTAKGAWNVKAASEVDLKPGLPPLDPALQEFPITEISAYSLNTLLNTQALGPFIERHTEDLSRSMDEEALMEKLHEAIDDYDPGDDARLKNYKKALYAEIKQSEKLFLKYLMATSGIKITIA